MESKSSLCHCLGLLTNLTLALNSMEGGWTLKRTTFPAKKKKAKLSRTTTDQKPTLLAFHLKAQI